MGFRKFAKKFGRKAAKKLNPLTKLKKLEVREPKVTPAALTRLRSALSLP